MYNNRLRSPLTEEGYESCIGCGWCCKKARCWVGVRLHGPGDNCPSLEFENGRYWCGVIRQAPPSQKKDLIDDLSIGAGCCANLNTERQMMLAKQSPSDS